MLLLSLLAACSSPPPPAPSRSTVPGVEGVLGGGTPTSVAEGTPAPSPGPSGNAPPAVAARAALDAYLDGILAQDLARSLSASDGGARRIALVRSILRQHNRRGGATTSVRLGARRFTVRSARPERVTFAGSVAVRSTVAAPDRTPEVSERTLSDPVVERRAGRWVVTTFRWDGRPVEARDGAGSATIGPVELRLEGSVAFGEVIGVVVVLVAHGEHRVRVEGDRLRVDRTEAAAGFRTLIEGQPALLYLTYPRREGEPDLWRATVIVDEGEPADATLGFG